MATAGTGALLGMAGCGTTSQGAEGSAPAMQSDASDADHPFVGSVMDIEPDASGLVTGVMPDPGCDSGRCPGLAPYEPEAGLEAAAPDDAGAAHDAGDAGQESDGAVTDAGSDAHFCCGVVVQTDH